MTATAILTPHWSGKHNELRWTRELTCFRDTPALQRGAGGKGSDLQMLTALLQCGGAPTHATNKRTTTVELLPSIELARICFWTLLVLRVSILAAFCMASGARSTTKSGRAHGSP